MNDEKDIPRRLEGSSHRAHIQSIIRLDYKTRNNKRERQSRVGILQLKTFVRQRKCAGKTSARSRSRVARFQSKKKKTPKLDKNQQIDIMSTTQQNKQPLAQRRKHTHGLKINNGKPSNQGDPGGRIETNHKAKKNREEQARRNWTRRAKC